MTTCIYGNWILITVLMSSRNLCLASSRESKSICDKDQHKVSVITTISEDTNLRLLMPYGTKS